MRGDAPDPDLWGDLYDRFRTADTPPRERPWWSYGVGGRGRGRGSLPPESKVRLIDAALGIVGSVRTFAEVAEEVLLEQRDRIDHASPPPDGDARPAPRPAPTTEPWPAAPMPAGRAADRGRGPARPVQDIPMEEP